MGSSKEGRGRRAPAEGRSEPRSRGSSTLVLLLLAAGASFAYLGCNAIIGLEVGELDEGAGGSTSASGSVSVSSAGGAGPGGGGTGASGGQTATTGTGGACSPPCDGDTPTCLSGVCVACSPDAKRCVGDVPQTCDAEGTWQSGPKCVDPTPICASGTCVSTRLRGGLGTMGARPASPGAVRIRDEGFEYAAPTCNATACVKGGIVP